MDLKLENFMKKEKLLHLQKSESEHSYIMQILTVKIALNEGLVFISNGVKWIVGVSNQQFLVWFRRLEIKYS